MGILKALLVFLRAMLIPKAQLAVENLALRQQLAVCRQSVKRPKLRPRDRVFWVLLSCLWPNWRTALAKYMVRTRKPPSQTWRTFLDNHVPTIAAGDFFTVPTVTFRVLYAKGQNMAPIVSCGKTRRILVTQESIFSRSMGTSPLNMLG